MSLIPQGAELRSLSTLPQGKILDPFRFTTFYIYFALVLCAFILSCFKEKPPLFSPENVDTVSLPQEGAGASKVYVSAQMVPAAPFLQSHPKQGLPPPQLVNRLSI